MNKVIIRKTNGIIVIVTLSVTNRNYHIFQGFHIVKKVNLETVYHAYILNLTVLTNVTHYLYLLESTSTNLTRTEIYKIKR